MKRKFEEDFTDISELEQDYAVEEAEDDDFSIDELDLAESEEEIEDELEVKNEAKFKVGDKVRGSKSNLNTEYTGIIIDIDTEENEPIAKIKWTNKNHPERKSLENWKTFDEIALLNESSQKRRRCEALSFQDQNKMLEKRVKEVVAAAEHIQERFKYRTLQNMSYTPEQSAKILYKLEDVLLDARDNINKLWNEIG